MGGNISIWIKTRTNSDQNEQKSGMYYKELRKTFIVIFKPLRTIVDYAKSSLLAFYRGYKGYFLNLIGRKISDHINYAAGFIPRKQLYQFTEL